MEIAAISRKFFSSNWKSRLSPQIRERLHEFAAVSRNSRASPRSRSSLIGIRSCLHKFAAVSTSSQLPQWNSRPSPQIRGCLHQVLRVSMEIAAISRKSPASIRMRERSRRIRERREGSNQRLRRVLGSSSWRWGRGAPAAWPAPLPAEGGSALYQRGRARCPQRAAQGLHPAQSRRTVNHIRSTPAHSFRHAQRVPQSPNSDLPTPKAERYAFRRPYLLKGSRLPKNMRNVRGCYF
jgi:hypothetical protein